MIVNNFEELLKVLNITTFPPLSFPLKYTRPVNTKHYLNVDSTFFFRISSRVKRYFMGFNLKKRLPESKS